MVKVKEKLRVIKDINGEWWFFKRNANLKELFPLPQQVCCMYPKRLLGGPYLSREKARAAWFQWRKTQPLS
jgi:hypothetical protein